MMDSVQDKIMVLLSSECTIEDVAKGVGISRITASKYLAVMEARGTISRRNIGMAKLFRRRW